MINYGYNYKNKAINIGGRYEYCYRRRARPGTKRGTFQ